MTERSLFERTLTTCTSRCCRYVSTLTLVRIRLEQKGYYTVHVANEDDSKEMTFDLLVKGEKVGLLSPSPVYKWQPKSEATHPFLKSVYLTMFYMCSVPPQIIELSDHHLPEKKHAVTCVAEGVPSPTIQWLSCDSMHKWVHTHYYHNHPHQHC